MLSKQTCYCDTDIMDIQLTKQDIQTYCETVNNALF